MSIIISDPKSSHVATVDDSFHLLIVGLSGFTIQDLADRFPDAGVALHVKDGDKWVPVTIDDIKQLEE